jgi:hypothetical protein
MKDRVNIINGKLEENDDEWKKKVKKMKKIIKDERIKYKENINENEIE